MSLLALERERANALRDRMCQLLSVGGPCAMEAIGMIALEALQRDNELFDAAKALASAEHGWQPIESAPDGYDGTRFHHVLFLGHSAGRSFDGPACVSGWMNSDRKPVHNYSYKLKITHWQELPESLA